MTDTGPLILVIDDEAPIRRFLRATLTSHGYRLLEAGTAQEGLRLAASKRPDLVLLDLGLPDLDGLEVTARVREWSQTPLVVLSARGQERDKVAALDAGADDYLTKPFGVDELLARIRVALRHAERMRDPAAAPVVEIDDLRIDLAARRVLLGGEAIHLTPIQYSLLAVLARHAGKVVTHTQLLKEVWGPHYGRETHYLRVYMGQLRQKLEADPARPRYLLTEPGVGYRLISP
ncbi:MAG TPA: response regulator [Roseiflexaceae bacterium]|nr:response regulator [Roseiflexaceae bacterium]